MPRLLLYCVKAKPYLADFKGEYQTYSNGKELDELWDKGFNLNDIMNILNGKIVAECDFEIKKITDDRLARAISDEMFCIQRDNLLKGSCLTGEEIKKYFNFYNWKFEKQDKVIGYAIHIKNLHIFDEPRELNSVRYKNHSVKSAPQNMMKVYDYSGEYYILISIKPEWLCKILNGEKTIECRKRILKEMMPK